MALKPQLTTVRQWIEEMWAPCRAKPNYGLSWWLNDDGTVWPAAPATGASIRAVAPKTPIPSYWNRDAGRRGQAW